MMTSTMPLPHPTPDEAWALIQSRDPRADGQLFYGVRTTRIFCRPSCPSRRPIRNNVELFPDIIHALRAGYRPCKRCSPAGIRPEAQLIQTLCAHLNQNHDRPVRLAELARIAQLSPFTIQRLFQRVLGISPSQYQSHQRAASFRRSLAKPQSRITDAIYDAGYSSSSRAYSGQPLGMQPKDYRNRGLNQSIGYASGQSPLGTLLIAATSQGLCAVTLASSHDKALDQLRAQFPAADLQPGSDLAPMLAQVLSQLTEHPAALDLPLDLRATAFQMRVWQALRAIPRGETRTYSQLARAIGQPTAARAVARACATNPAAIVVPCHRVIGSNASLTGYRWGLDRKKRLLQIEAASLSQR
ncbi:MAG TPA: bifunctional DNA-binding transcriptional regulator/O6-methylguanine-DNA methyltransferase Ada [Acidobacteriaceae bacterium]|nr:bifunctional DNA-binding transcriptional regulator/O6-methylguanine-DNA methyltransferase Ada [Acidobacteriaceae bacterium]